MNRIEKQENIDTFRKVFSTMKGAILADFRGLNVQKVTNLRADLRKEGIRYKVIKNKLAKKACAGTASENLTEYFTGPTAFAYTMEDPVILAKVLTDFAKKEQNFRLKVGYLEGKIIPEDRLKDVANLPPKEILIAKLLGSMNAPINGLVNVLAGPVRAFVQVLGAIQKKKEENA